LTSVKSFGRDRSYKGFGLEVRNFAISIAQVVLINAKPFAPVSARAVRGIQNPFFDTVQGNVKCLLP